MGRSGRAGNDKIKRGRKGVPAWAFAAGTVLLAVSVGASVMLALEHIVGLSLPGCGPGSGCEQAARSVWGKVPGLGWPVSFVGLAYFTSILAAWVGAWTKGWDLGGVPRWVARLGAAASLGFVAVMLVHMDKWFCPYCLAAHAGNLGFVVVFESALAGVPARTGVGERGARRQAIVTGVLVFGAITGALTVPEINARTAADQERLAAQRQIEREAADRKTTPAPAIAVEFTGRYRMGPDPAALRIVMLTDYQCGDCKRVEAEIMGVLEAHRDKVSLSIKHFPMCTDCNRYSGPTLHTNACWAARAAETAGILQGNDGFWRMHRWLLDRGGSFTNPELQAGLPALGFDTAKFEAVMNSERTLSLVLADVAEGADLGLHSTPMVFINGVELRGWQTAGAVVKTVEAVLATNPAPAAATADKPPKASEKFVADWREQTVWGLPDDERSWSMGAPEGAAVEVVLWGDYQEPYTAQADQQVRDSVKRRGGASGNVRYTFRHFPVDKQCNPDPKITVTIHAQACLASRAAEAAGSLAGNEGYWKMHEWLMTHQPGLTLDAIRQAAKGMGIQDDALVAVMDSGEVTRAIEEDCRAGQSVGLTSIPLVYINRKVVPRPLREGDDVLARIIDEAASASRRK